MVLVCIHIYLYTHTHAHTHTCTHTHTGILLSLNKGGHSAICNNMDEPGGHRLSKIRWIQRGKSMISLTFGI